MSRELQKKAINQKPDTERIISSLVLCLVATLTACASTNRQPAASGFGTLDTNGDQKVSRAEYSEARLRRAFDKLDLNGDQKISFEEWKRLDRSPQTRANFELLDENGDDYITVAEFLNLAPKHSNLDQIFTTMDTNSDNYLSQDEVNEEPAVKLFSVQF